MQYSPTQIAALDAEAAVGHGEWVVRQGMDAPGADGTTPDRGPPALPHVGRG